MKLQTTQNQGKLDLKTTTTILSSLLTQERIKLVESMLITPHLQ